MSELTPRNHQLSMLRSNDDGQLRCALPKSPLHRPNSAPGVDPYRAASLEDPPKSDRSHYPKYKPLVFPAAQHDSSSPEYTGPLIQTPRIKPCEAASQETAQRLKEPIVPSNAAAANPHIPLSSIAVRWESDRCTGSQLEAIEGQTHARSQGCTEQANAPTSDQQNMHGGICEALPDSMSESEPGEGSECEITVALNTGSGPDELMVEENDSSARTEVRRRHLFVPAVHAAAETCLGPSVVTMEEKLLTERCSDVISSSLQIAQVLAAEPSERLEAARKDSPVIDLAPEEGVQSLNASEAGHCSQFSSRLSSMTGALNLPRGPPKSNRLKLAHSSDESGRHSTRPGHAQSPEGIGTPLSAKLQCEHVRLSCDFTDDTHEEGSELHDSFPDGPPCPELGPPQDFDPQEIFMHDNPLCWPESPGQSAASLAHVAAVPPQHCPAPAVQSAVPATVAAAWHTQPRRAENTATKETQTSTKFTTAALRAVFDCSHNATAASSSASFSIGNPASDSASRGATAQLTENDPPTEDLSAVLSPVHESSDTNCMLPTLPMRCRDPGSATPPRSFLSAARSPPHLAPTRDISSGAKLSSLATSSAIAVDNSVCLSETGTVFESCCEPSSVHSSLDITSGDGELGRESCWAGTVSSEHHCGDVAKNDSGSAPGGSESFETASGSGAVGYFACPPNDDSKAQVTGAEQELDDNDKTDTTGVFERMRAVVSTRLCKISPRLARAAAKSDGHAAGPSATDGRVQPSEGALQVFCATRDQLEAPVVTCVSPTFKEVLCKKPPPDSSPSLAMLSSQGRRTTNIMQHQPECASQMSKGTPADKLRKVRPNAPAGPQEVRPGCVLPSEGIPKLQLPSPAPQSGIPNPSIADESSMLPSSSMAASESFRTTCWRPESDSGSGTVTTETLDAGSQDTDQGMQRNLHGKAEACVEDTRTKDATSSLLPAPAGEAETAMESHTLPISENQDVSEALSIGLGASQSLTASFLHDSAASTCSAPSFKFSVHERTAHAHSPDTDSSSSSLHPHAFALDAHGSSTAAFRFTHFVHADDGRRHTAHAGGVAGAAHTPQGPEALQPSCAGSHAPGSMSSPYDPCAAVDSSSASMHMQTSVRYRVPQPFMSSYAALTPCAPGAVPLRLETVDEHTPSPMHSLQDTALHMPPCCASKARPGVAAMMHTHPHMHGDPSPDITWSPLRQRGMQLPSPNYSSPAALGAAHGQAMPGHPMRVYGHMLLPMVEPSAGVQGQAASLPVSPSHAAAASVLGPPASGGPGNSAAVGDRRRGGAGRLPWLCMASPRTSSATGEASAAGAASEAVAEAGARWRERERGGGIGFWRRQQPGPPLTRDDSALAPLPDDVGRDLILPYAGNGPHALLQAPAEISASVAATTVTLSDALLPMPPGDAGTESLELQNGMSGAAGATAYPSGVPGPGSYRSGDMLDITGPSHSGGVARLLPHHSSTIPSDVLSNSETRPADTRAPAAAARHAVDDFGVDPRYMGVEAPASSGSTHSDTGRADQVPESRSSRMEAYGQVPADIAGEAASVHATGQDILSGPAGALGNENAIDGAVRTAASARLAVQADGHVRQDLEQPGRAAAAAQGKGSWMGMWACCGKKGMAEY